MRLLTATIVLIMLACASAWGVDTIACYTGSSEQGGNRLTVNGIQTSQFAQQSYPTASVTVYLHGTVTLATPIYADAAASQQITNPFSSSSNGVAFWCAADGFYDVQYSGSGITTPFTVNDIKLSFAGGGGGGGTGCVTNPSDGGCAIPGIPSIDLFVCASGTGTACIGGGNGWISQLLTNRLNLTVPISIAGTTAGVVSLGCATDPGLGSGIALVAPASCTPYNIYWPQTAGSGFLRGSNAANKVTNVFQSFIDLTADVGTTILPVVDGGTGNSTASGALVNLFPTPTRVGDTLYWNGSAWNNFAGNTATPAFYTQNSGGTPGWVAVPVPIIDGGTGLVTLTSNTVYKGNGTSAMVATGIVEDTVKVSTTLPIKVPAVAFSALASCGPSIEGEHAAVTDSTTNTWGATITGGSTNHVLAYCDGTSWTVAGK